MRWRVDAVARLDQRVEIHHLAVVVEEGYRGLARYPAWQRRHRRDAVFGHCLFCAHLSVRLRAPFAVTALRGNVGRGGGAP